MTSVYSASSGCLPNDRATPSVKRIWTILLVDTDEDWRVLTSAALEEAGHHVLLVARPEDALAFVDANLELDLIIVDLDRAIADGRSLLEFVTLNRPELPILLHTSTIPHEPDILKGLALGIAKYVPKGAAPELIHAAAQLLGPQASP